MSDEQTKVTGSGGSGSDESTLNIPEEIRSKFPEYIELILHSESMNTEERQYWIDILPVMDEEQLKQLRDILENEKAQLSAIDEQYANEMTKLGEKRSIAQMTDDRKKKLEARSEVEEKERDIDAARAEDVLKQMEEA